RRVLFRSPRPPRRRSAAARAAPKCPAPPDRPRRTARAAGRVGFGCPRRSDSPRAVRCVLSAFKAKFRRDKVRLVRVFVTGGTGFIGGRLGRKLRDRGHEVVALVRSPDGAPQPERI